MEEFALMARESEKAMLQDLRERLGVYVTIVKKTEDERDSLRDKLAQAGQQSERDVAALQARIDKLEGDLDAVQAELNRLRRREGALRQHQEGEREAHEETRKLLEDARKRAEAAERRATEAEEAEDKILNELEGLRAQLDARNKAYEELDRNKDDAMRKLMGKKDEQLQAAHRGWVSETDAKLTDIQKRLHDEHQKEVQALERDLLNRTRDLQKQSDSHAKVVTLLHEKIKVLDRRYKENYALWEKKVSEVTAQRDEYYQAKEEYQNKYHRLINPKIMCDAELRHLKHMLDAEEKRLDIPIRVTGEPRSVGEEAEQDGGTTHDEHSITSDDASFTVRKTKEVGEPDGVVITGVHLDEKRVVIENRGSDDVDMTQWRIKLEFADQRGESFSLPSHYALLKKGATMTIRVAEEPTGKRKRTAAEREETDLVWLYSGQNWAEESYCKATLLDEKGEDVYTYIMGPNERVVDLPSRASAEAKAFAVPITPEKALPATRSTSQRGTHYQDSPRAKECRLS